MKLFSLLCALIALAACSQQPESAKTATPPAISADIPAGSYTLDKAHASMVFRVSHLGFSHYTAKFKNFDVQLQFDPRNMTAATISATIDPKSLSLNTPPSGFLDQLLGAQWLDVAQFP